MTLLISILNQNSNLIVYNPITADTFNLDLVLLNITLMVLCLILTVGIFILTLFKIYNVPNIFVTISVYFFIIFEYACQTLYNIDNSFWINIWLYNTTPKMGTVIETFGQHYQDIARAKQHECPTCHSSDTYSPITYGPTNNAGEYDVQITKTHQKCGYVGPTVTLYTARLNHPLSRI